MDYVKLGAVSTAGSILKRKIQNHTTQDRFISLALAFLLCGIFYSLVADSGDSAFAKEKNKKDTVDIVCEKALPQASIADPALELYKIEDLCNKPQKQRPQDIAPPEDPAVTELREQLEEILDGTPMEDMIDSISKQDRTVAAFLVGIAFKESKFGVYSPKINGVDCNNYWGFKGKTNPTFGGYSCFSSPEQAVEIVGERLQRFVSKNGYNTPAMMTVWKCGSSCATHTPESVAKWISDVSIHFYSLSKT